MKEVRKIYTYKDEWGNEQKVWCTYREYLHLKLYGEGLTDEEYEYYKNSQTKKIAIS